MLRPLVITLAAIVSLLQLVSTNVSQADSLPPLIKLGIYLCVRASDGKALQQIPFRGQTIQLNTIPGGSFGLTTPLFEYPSPVEYTLYYTDGIVKVPGQSNGKYDDKIGPTYNYTYVTIVGELAQPYVEVQTTPILNPASPYSFTLKTRQNFVASPGVCSDESKFTADWSPVPDPYIAQAVDMSGPGVIYVGKKVQAWVDLKNVGNVAWNRPNWWANVNPPIGQWDTLGTVLLATANPPDRTSPFYDASEWVGPNRPAMKENEETINPGQTGRFTFTLQAPAIPGIYSEYFQPVVEGFTWFDGPTIRFDINVQAEPLNLPYKVYLPLAVASASGW